MSSKICIIDNYDSFTYNLVQLVREESGEEPFVVRNDKIDVAGLASYERIVLSPGPGLPSEAGIMPDLVKEYAPSKKILGICLGHQCIGEVFGATLVNMESVKHGKGLQTTISTENEPLFAGIESPFVSARYHSWVVSKSNFPDELEITASDEEGIVMALRHRTYAVKGLQFHPESVLTECGARIIRNWIEE